MTQFLSFETLFQEATDKQPHAWQKDLSIPSECGNRLIRIPTGFGKTLGVLLVWLWHRVIQNNENWPRRLVWCLPMRVLAEQTEREVRSVLDSIGRRWDEQVEHDGKVGVHLLMGGTNDSQWHLHPEQEAVLIGTQDMLLSRAMNRGYACPRARWPMEFGLLNQDTLWVMDEVQLMDVGLATSGQLQAFRNQDLHADKFFRPCNTWWMSATLQADWLNKSPDTAKISAALASNTFRIQAHNRIGDLWDGVSRTIETVQCADTRALSEGVIETHCRRQSERYNQEPTLVVVNTVKRAVETWKALKKDKRLKEKGTDIRLVHSRFRPIDRMEWATEFLNRQACSEQVDRIIVSTQVIEAGVDISTTLLFTELAPWPSLVQRFGRCARWGGAGRVIVLDFGLESDDKALPYSLDELSASLNALGTLSDVGPRQLEEFEDSHPESLRDLYPYEPRNLLFRHELQELFDTSPDLSGADIDISRFIRSGSERDLQVFWVEIDQKESPPASRKPDRQELCSVPFLEARQWLCGSGKSEGLSEGKRAWVWDWLSREWRSASRRDLYPGQTVLVATSVGGYNAEQGWDRSLKEIIQPIQNLEQRQYLSRPCWKWDGKEGGWEPSERQVSRTCREDSTDDAEDDESLSIKEEWQTIAGHGLQVGLEAERIANLVCSDLRPILNLAGRWHDLGKAHPAFQACIQADDRPLRNDLAKAPDRAWPCSSRNMYRVDEHEQRRGFRHELASTLGLFAVLQRHKPEHEALLGTWREWFEALGKELSINPCTSQPNAIEREILDLSASEFDLLAYLVCAHHGKVRMAWHASPSDQGADDSRLRIRGVRNGDLLPPVRLASKNGQVYELPAASLDLSPSEIGLSHRTGRSWSERTLNLLEKYGPFSLAWLETLLRVADQRASQAPAADTSLNEDQHTVAEYESSEAGREEGGPTMAQATARGVSEVDSSTIRKPYRAPRYVESEVGILTYQELAPLLAERVGSTKLDIVERKFVALPFQELLLELHRRVCGDLLPNIAGRWRVREAVVGSRIAPHYWRVSAYVQDFADQLEARLLSIRDDDPDGDSSQVAGVLAFAEGRILHIHPFEDFNGHVVRLFLIELMHRMDIPVVDTAAQSQAENERYLTALSAFDRDNPRPLVAVWERRLSRKTG